MPKIVVRLFGGLGNQLFIYAAAKRLSISSGNELIIDDISGFESDTKFRRTCELKHFRIEYKSAKLSERLWPFAKFRRKFLIFLNSFRTYEARTYYYQENVDFDPRLLDLKPKGDIFLDGYWQSEGYFKDFEEQIRNDLEIIPPNDPKNISISEKIVNCNAVAVHVRFFDNASNCSYGNGNRYYEKAISVIEDRIPSAHYFIFSDRPTDARKLVPITNDRVTLVFNNDSESAYADLWLMSQCKHFIIANSTFSWWGAWLSKSDSKIVIAPGIVKNSGEGSWGFKGLLPNDWLAI